MAGRETGALFGGSCRALDQLAVVLVRRVFGTLPTVVSLQFTDYLTHKAPALARHKSLKNTMNTIIYIVGLVVVIGFILSYFGFR